MNKESAIPTGLATEERIRLLEPGPPMNEFIHEYIFGHRLCPTHHSYGCCGNTLPSYSRDGNAALYLMSAMAFRGWMVEIEQIDTPFITVTMSKLDDNNANDVAAVEGDALAHAMCVCALLAELGFTIKTLYLRKKNDLHCCSRCTSFVLYDNNEWGCKRLPYMRKPHNTQSIWVCKSFIMT